jgi:DNA-binding transcriptional MerR regulator
MSITAGVYRTVVAARSYPGDVTDYDLTALARAAGVTPRTVRYYQGTGLLPAPQRAGRQARYGTHHLTRLRQIGELQERGLRLESIRDVFEASSSGQAPAVALLGPELASESWLAESSRQFTAVQLAELLGERDLGLVGDLEQAGYLRQVQTDDGARWQADDLPLLLGALQLSAIGTDVALSGRGRDLMRRRIRRMAEDLVRLWLAEEGRQYRGVVTTDELLAELDRIRAVAWQSAAHIMAQEIDRAVSRADELAVSPPSVAASQE